MLTRLAPLTLASLALPMALAGRPAPLASANTYAVDNAHAAAVFHISHLGLSQVYGRFKDLSGNFTADPKDASSAKFELSAKVDSVDTGNTQRDNHLKSPDFFDAKQFPTMTFTSASAKSIDGGFEVPGTLTIHGVSKPVTLTLKGGRTAEFPQGVQRTGYVAEFNVKRSDFGMTKMAEAIGDEVHVEISFEGTKK